MGKLIPTINYTDNIGNPVRKVLFEISDKETGDYKSLGVGMGIDIFHCIYLGSRYTSNFLNRVVCYCVRYKDEATSLMEQKTNQPYVRIEFFEQK